MTDTPPLTVGPQFPGGDTELLNYVAHNTTYPRNSRGKRITGKVYVSYTVGERGRVGRVPQGLLPETDQEAHRVAASLLAFRPGWEYRVTTAMAFTVPIHFSLSFSLFNGVRPRPTEARTAQPAELC